MTVSLQIKTAAEAENLIREAEQHIAKEREAAAERPSNTSNRIPTTESISILDGKTTTRSNGVVSVTAERPLPAGFCRLANGMIEPWSSVKAAGLEDMIVEVAGDDALPFEQTRLVPRKGDEIRNLSNAEEQSDKANSKDEDRPKLEGATPEEQQQIAKAHDALNQAKETIGAYAVDSLQEDVVASGELPSADDLPEGITPEMVQSVADAYTAQANTVLRTVPGASVTALQEMLNDSELKEARVAAFTGNDQQLKDLAYKAVSRLQKLPDDPTTLKQLTAHWPATHKVVRRGSEWWVTTPTAEMPWSDLVASGEIRFA
jgi:hypothetical protein